MEENNHSIENWVNSQTDDALALVIACAMDKDLLDYVVQVLTERQNQEKNDV